MLSPVRKVHISNIEIGGNAPLAVIAGPCVIESEEHCLMMAARIREICARVDIPFIFKASYDKANRSSVQAFRGPGLDDGLRVLQRVREELAVPVLSDVHSLVDIVAAAEVLDCLQVPAFLSRQTDMLLAAGETGKPVAVKKGQFLAPWDVQPLVAKVESTGNKNVLITERGFSFGYNNLVSDMRALPTIRSFGVPVIFDATHSVQLPGGLGEASGGERAMVPILARAAVAAGVDAIFMEVHDRPEEALCDGPNMVRLSELEGLLRALLRLDEVVREPERAGV